MSKSLKKAPKLGKSEMNLVKEYCTRASDEALGVLSQTLPQTIAFDRAQACAILQEDKEVDRWLGQASGAEDFFSKIDEIGEYASAELETRSKKN